MPTISQQAEYEVLIPKTDNAGNPIRNLSTYAYQHLSSQIPLVKAHIESNRRVFWEGREEPFDVLIVVAQDEPKTDSTVKQLASFLGQASNQDVILVSKHGKNGVQAWPIKNNKHVPGQSAQPHILTQPQSTATL